MNLFHSFFQKSKKTLHKIQEKVEKLQKTPPELAPKLTPPPAPSREHVVFEVSPFSVAKSTLVILFLLGAAYFLREIADILVVFFVAFLLAAAMEPAIDWMARKKIPRGLSVILFYIVVFGLLAFVLSSLLPILARQVSELAGRLNDLIQNISQLPADRLPFGDQINRSLSQFLASVNVHGLVGQLESNLQVFAQQLFVLGGNVWELIKVISNGLINTFLVLILAFFMTVEKHAIENFILSLFPMKHAQYVADRIVMMKKKIGYWLRAMFILMFSIGMSVYLGLVLLGVDYAAILGILAGILEIIPIIGPPLSWLLAVPIVANQSSWLLLWVTILYVFVQQVEGHILVPIIMKRVIGLSSIAVIFALLVGARFLGILGIVLSIPVATMISIFLEDYLGRRSNFKS